MRASRGVGEQQGDVLLPDVAAVNSVGGTGAALDPAGDFAFTLGAAVDQQRDFGEVARRAAGGAGEDDVFHAAAAQGLGAAFAHHPAQRFEQVRLAAAVGTDHARQPRLDPKFGRFDEAFEAGQDKAAEAHGVRSSFPRASPRASRQPKIIARP